MELFIFGRFHALAGREAALEAAIRDVVAPSRKQAGCVGINAFRSIRDVRLFYIHSRWRDESAFEIHATLPHTTRFLERVEPLIDHEFDIARTVLIG